jgi:hypothetical protein
MVRQMQSRPYGVDLEAVRQFVDEVFFATQFLDKGHPLGSEGASLFRRASAHSRRAGRIRRAVELRVAISSLATKLATTNFPLSLFGP